MNDREMVENLVVLVRRLSRALRKADPDNELPSFSIGFLQRHKLFGSPMREDQAKESE